MGPQVFQLLATLCVASSLALFTRDPSMGPRVFQLLATLCVASSLALFTWGGTILAGGFCL
jgi:hypothetical protein